MRAKFKETRVKINITRSVHQDNTTIFLDKQFCSISLYLTQKILEKYSKVK